MEKLEILENARIDTNTNKKKKEAWNSVHNLFNTVSKHNRTLEQIQNQWRKTKSIAKTKNSAYVRQRKQTGGGPAPVPLNTVEEELVCRLPKHFEIDSNIYDSNSSKIETNSPDKTDYEVFNAEEDTPIKNPIEFKRKKNIKCQSEFENEKRIKLLDISIKQKELEIKYMEENHNIQKRRIEKLEIQENEEHILKLEKIKLEVEKLKISGFFT